MEMSMPKMKMRVTVEEADNGYMVSCYDDKGEKKVVAKSLNEVAKAVKQMFGGESESNKELGYKVASRMK
jgi:hypothetical protein